MDAITINLGVDQRPTPGHLSSSETVRKIIICTYLFYRKMFSKGMITHREYFSVIRRINP